MAGAGARRPGSLCLHIEPWIVNILLVAEESAGMQTLRALARTGHRIVAVLSSSPSGTSRGAVVADFAAQLAVPRWPAELVKTGQLAERMQAEAVDLLLNVHSLAIAHPAVVEAPRIGSFNLHPGPLPRYAGLNAPSWAIYHGESTHGVTVHWMEKGVDTGSIAYQTLFEIEPRDTGLTLSMKCVREGLPLLLDLVETAAARPDSIPAVAQDPRKRNYFGRGVPQQGVIDWAQPARRVIDFIRACDYAPLPSPWGAAKAAVALTDEAEPLLQLEVVKAAMTGLASIAPPGTVDRCADGRVQVATADEWIEISRVRINARSLPAREVLRPGQRLPGWASAVQAWAATRVMPSSRPQAAQR